LGLDYLERGGDTINWREPVMDTRRLAELVMGHAKVHYEDGWDYVVECYSIDELAEEIKHFGYTSVADYAKGVADYNEHRDEIRAEIF
jgi:hypothetical protein